MSDRTLIILSETGQHVSCSRVAAPSAEELAGFAASLSAWGVGGFLVLMHGRYHSKRPVQLQMLEAINTNARFDDTVAAFEAIRKARG